MFLDEPTTGLDPGNRKIIRDKILYLNKESGGNHIFLTTQYLEEADQLADRISIINEGIIVASGAQDELKRSIGKDVVDLSFDSQSETARAAELLRDLEGSQKCFERNLRLFLENGTSKLPEVVRLLDQIHLYKLQYC